MKDIRVNKIVKETRTEGLWGELESKKGFQRQSFKKISETNSSFHVK